MRRLLLFGLMD